MIILPFFTSWHTMNNNNSSNKRKSSTHAASPPPSKKSPLHAFSPPRMSATSPPHYSLQQQQQQQQNRPLTTAAAAVAAMKRGNNPTTSQQQQQQPSQYRRQSNSTAPPSRQGSVETDREGSVAASTVAEDEAVSVANKDEAGKDGNTKEEAEAEDDEKEDVVVDFNANMQAQMEKAKEDMKVLLENFSDDQLQRYEGYRRSALNRTNVKRVSDCFLYVCVYIRDINHCKYISL